MLMAFASAAAPAKTMRMAAESTEQMKAMEFQAKKPGFVVGSHIVNKQAEQAEVWQLTTADADGAIVNKLVDGHVADTKTVNWTDIIENWKVHKGKVTAIVDIDAGSPLASSSWELDCIKGAIAIALRS